MLRAKDEEIERLIVQRTQDLSHKHEEALDALALDHAGKLKDAVDRAEAAEATRAELASKVEKLEVNLAELTKEISTLKDDREKALYDLTGPLYLTKPSFSLRPMSPSMI